MNRSHLEPTNRGGWCRGRVFKGKGIERKTNGGNINPAKTKVSLADLTFPCARSRVCSPCFHRFETEASGRREMGILGKLLSSVSLVSIWCLLIVEPGKVQREQDHLGKSSLYCNFALRFTRRTTSFPLRFRPLVYSLIFIKIYNLLENRKSSY